jgi:hypothetical protein
MSQPVLSVDPSTARRGVLIVETDADCAMVLERLPLASTVRLQLYGPSAPAEMTSTPSARR